MRPLSQFCHGMLPACVEVKAFSSHRLLTMHNHHAALVNQPYQHVVMVLWAIPSALPRQKDLRRVWMYIEKEKVEKKKIHG